MRVFVVFSALLLGACSYTHTYDAAEYCEDQQVAMEDYERCQKDLANNYAGINDDLLRCNSRAYDAYPRTLDVNYPTYFDLPYQGVRPRDRVQQRNWLYHQRVAIVNMCMHEKGWNNSENWLLIPWA